MKVGDQVHGLQERRNGRGEYHDELYYGTLGGFRDGVPMVDCGNGVVVAALQRSAVKLFFCRATGSHKEAWVQVKAPFPEDAAKEFCRGWPLSLIGHPISTLDAGAVWSIDVWENGEVTAYKVKITTTTTYEVVE